MPNKEAKAGAEGYFNLVGGAVHGAGEKKRMQGEGHIGSGFGSGREAVARWDGEGMKSDEIRMKMIQGLYLGLGLFWQNEGDGVAS